MKKNNNFCYTTHRPAANRQAGAMLLEVLVAILLFALGCISLLSVQARNLNVTHEIQNRAEAMRLASDYVARIATHQGTAQELAALFANKEGTEYQTFASEVLLALPGAKAPVVTIQKPTNTTPASSSSPTAFSSSPTADSSNPAANNSDPELINANVSVRLSWNDKETGLLHSYHHVSAIGFQAR